jgi:hypothetical protein
MKISIVIAFFLIITCSLNGQIPNGGFEMDPNNAIGWQAAGNNATILQTYDAYDESNRVVTTINPFAGQNFVMLKTGGGTQETNYSQLTQHITVTAGHNISGVYFFDAGDYRPYNDTGAIKLSPDQEINPNLSEITLAIKTVEDVGNYGAMEEWQSFSHTFTELDAGSYILTLRVEDAIDNILASYLLVDNVALTPEPATLLMLGFGTAALRYFRKC